MLRAPEEMVELFAGIDRDAALRTVEIAERLEFDLTRELGYRYPDFSDGVDPAIRQLAQICECGVRRPLRRPARPCCAPRPARASRRSCA